LDHPVSRQKGSFSLPDRPGIMFVFSPDTDFTTAQARDLLQWVRDGGTLVYADAGPDPRLEQAFGLSSAEAFVGGSVTGPEGSTNNARLTVAAPVLDGVTTLESAPDVVNTYSPKPGQVPVLRLQLQGVGEDGRAVGMLETVGKGRAFFLGDPLVLANGYLGKADNGRFAADLLALAPPGAPVRFDEYHHGAGGASASLNDWVTTPWGAALGFSLVVFFLGFLVRGRSFGPPISIASARDRSSAEYASAVGTLLRRARARELTWKVLGDATRRALAERTGLGRSVPPDRVPELLERRAPALAGQLGEADTLAADVAASDGRLLKAARRLHALAYPSAKTR
jgi:hypothetical protein